MSHKILGDLLFAAYEDPRFNVDFDIEINQLWHSLNIPLRPGFVLQTALRKSTEQVVNRVTQPASIRSTSTSTTTLTGIVLGPRDIPIPGAKITLLNLGRWTNTDNQGQFQFAATLPTDNGERLRVEAKGLNIEFDTAEIPHADKKPLILKLNELEE